MRAEPWVEQIKKNCLPYIANMSSFLSIYFEFLASDHTKLLIFIFEKKIGMKMSHNQPHYYKNIKQKRSFHPMNDVPADFIEYKPPTEFKYGKTRF